MSQMKNDVLLYAYRKSIQPSIEWLIKQIPIIDGKFQYVFVVDKGNLPESVREPNYAMEDFVRRMIKSFRGRVCYLQGTFYCIEREKV